MSDRHLHIVCHDVPYPPDFGGVVDLFYKIRALHEKGIKIKLHCFTKSRSEAQELEKYCESVNYYKRDMGVRGLSTKLPYIVSSRTNVELLDALSKDTYPVLLEGVHCTAHIDKLIKMGRKILVRIHNVEHKYYKSLFFSEGNTMKRLYFYLEYRRLKNYERSLPQNIPYLAVSQKDAIYFQQVLNKKDVQYIPVFIPFEKIQSKADLGTYTLYHGNLSVPENEKAAIWLIDDVFSKLNIQLVIAGKSPSARLANKVKAYPHISLIVDPLDFEMQELIANAQINVLPSFNETGIKLKLINALYNGRHCVVNGAAVEGSDLEPACHVGNNSTAIASIVSQLFRQPFTEEEITIRRKILTGVFDNSRNADALIRSIY